MRLRLILLLVEITTTYMEFQGKASRNASTKIHEVTGTSSSQIWGHRRNPVRSHTPQLLSTHGSYHPPNARRLPTLHVLGYLSPNRRILRPLLP